MVSASPAWQDLVSNLTIVWLVSLLCCAVDSSVLIFRYFLLSFFPLSCEDLLDSLLNRTTSMPDVIIFPVTNTERDGWYETDC